MIIISLRNFLWGAKIGRAWSLLKQPSAINVEPKILGIVHAKAKDGPTTLALGYSPRKVVGTKPKEEPANAACGVPSFAALCTKAAFGCSGAGNGCTKAKDGHRKLI